MKHDFSKARTYQNCTRANIQCHKIMWKWPMFILKLSIKAPIINQVRKFRLENQLEVHTDVLWPHLLTMRGPCLYISVRIYEWMNHTIPAVTSLVPRSPPSFHRIQYRKSGKALTNTHTYTYTYLGLIDALSGPKPASLRGQLKSESKPWNATR